jgi:predicted  nucleic acid-binding Zn-ribbon protein
MDILDALPQLTELGLGGVIVIAVAWVLNSTLRYAMDKIAGVGKELAVAINALENASMKNIAAGEVSNVAIIKTLDLMRDNLEGNRHALTVLTTAFGDLYRATEADRVIAKSGRDRMLTEVQSIHVKLDNITSGTQKLVDLLDSHEKQSAQRSEIFQARLREIGDTLMRNANEMTQAVKELDTKLLMPMPVEAGEAVSDTSKPETQVSEKTT